MVRLNKRIRKGMGFILLAVLTGLLSVSCSGSGDIGPAPSNQVCSSIIDAKCVRCHYKTRICDALGTKSVGKWKQSVNFMVKQGAQLTEDEQNKVVACLAAMEQGSEIVCK